MRKLLLQLTLLLLVLSSCGDDASPTTPKVDIDPPQKGSIKGVVIDSTTNLPISGAIVSTFPITSSTRTNENGNFEILGISPDLYDLYITHKDYYAHTSKIRVSNGLTNDFVILITAMDSANNIPNKPTLLRPSDNFGISFSRIRFQWEGTDQDNDSLLYDIYFRTIGSDFKQIASNIKEENYVFVFQFRESVKYQWYVVAKDKYSTNTSGVFNFHLDKSALIDIPNMIGYWKFDRDTYDYGPNSYLSEMENVDFSPDRKENFESAANFKGKSSMKSNVVLPTSLQLTKEFTIALWVKPNSTSPGIGDNNSYYDCVSKWGDLKIDKASWAFGMNSSTSVFFTTYNNTSTLHTIYSPVLDRGLWQHIAVTFDYGISSIYINGKLISVAKKMNIPQESIYNATIGGRQDNKSAYNGEMDDLYIFDRALSDEEILQLFNE